MKAWAVILVCAMALATQDGWAKRMGGGGSFGRQSSNVTQRNATPPSSPAQTPTQSSNAAQQRPANNAATPAAAPKRNWGAMLGGLAAGLGLAWLASSLGLGEAFGQILLFALLGLVVVMAIGWFRRSQMGAQAGASRTQRSRPGDWAYQGAAPNADVNAQAPRSYSPQNVGNDASARPWEDGTATAFEANGGSMIGSALSGPQSWGIPAGFDVDGFLQASKTNFINLQAAWDKADMPALRAMMTDEMLTEITQQLAERERHQRGASNQTEVVMLEARLLGIEEQAAEYMASVEFSGLIREEPSAGPNAFREVWNITRPKAGTGGWLVAGVQALQ